MKYTFLSRNWFNAILLILLVAVMAGCGGGATGVSGGGGGGGGGGGASLSATLNWLPVTTNIDGSPLTELAGYRVHYGTASGNYTTTVDVADPSAANAIISGLQSGTTYYFAVTAYDTSGNQSSYSNEAVKTV